MNIIGIIWLDSVIEKLAIKHGVTPDEVEQLLSRQPRIVRIERGNVEGEDVYSALGRADNG
ncbi:MAG TPA: hypothetical protein VFX76_17390 [Roseiflexaceae bacterium]|nr:hypothetical protein [Roseiflexaceae bacterium]